MFVSPNLNAINSRCASQLSLFIAVSFLCKQLLSCQFEKQYFSVFCLLFYLLCIKVVAIVTFCVCYRLLFFSCTGRRLFNSSLETCPDSAAKIFSSLLVFAQWIFCAYSHIFALRTRLQRAADAAFCWLKRQGSPFSATSVNTTAVRKLCNQCFGAVRISLHCVFVVVRQGRP